MRFAWEVSRLLLTITVHAAENGFCNLGKLYGINGVLLSKCCCLRLPPNLAHLFPALLGFIPDAPLNTQQLRNWLKGTLLCHCSLTSKVHQTFSSAVLRFHSSSLPLSPSLAPPHYSMFPSQITAQNTLPGQPGQGLFSLRLQFCFHFCF